MIEFNEKGYRCTLCGSPHVKDANWSVDILDGPRSGYYLLSSWTLCEDCGSKVDKYLRNNPDVRSLCVLDSTAIEIGLIDGLEVLDRDGPDPAKRCGFCLHAVDHLTEVDNHGCKMMACPNCDTFEKRMKHIYEAFRR